MVSKAERSGKLVPGFTPELGDRIKRVVDAIGTQRKAAELLGVRAETIAGWQKGEQRPPFLDMIALCRASGFSIAWLATGEEVDSRSEKSQSRTEEEQTEVPVLHFAPREFAPDSTYVSVPALDVRGSAGHGSVVEREDVRAYIAFEATFLRSLGINPNYARILDLGGDSMFPTLRDGDRIVVDTSIEEVVDEGIYAVVLAGRLLIKRVQIRLDGSVVLRSDNRDAGYEDIVVSTSELDQMQVVGRVKIRLHLM